MPYACRDVPSLCSKANTARPQADCAELQVSKTSQLAPHASVGCSHARKNRTNPTACSGGDSDTLREARKEGSQRFLHCDSVEPELEVKSNQDELLQQFKVRGP
jgi:hypothetical protein